MEKGKEFRGSWVRADTKIKLSCELTHNSARSSGRNKLPPPRLIYFLKMYTITATIRFSIQDAFHPIRPKDVRRTLKLHIWRSVSKVMGKFSAGSILEFWLMKLDGMRFSLVLAWVGAAELQF